ncbi:MAG: BT4734/BF3469 family protein [Fluviicola sp.]
MNFLETKISFFTGGIKNTKPTDEISLYTYIKTIKGIQTRLYQKLYNKVSTDVDRSKIKLGKMPYVIAQALVTERKNNCVKCRTGIVSIDIDKIDDINAVFHQMKTDPYTLLVHRSISHKGLRVFVPVDVEQGEHLEYFNALEAYYLKEYGIQIDKACKDISRASILAHDPDIFVNDNCTELNGEFIDRWKQLPLLTAQKTHLISDLDLDLDLSETQKEYFGLSKLQSAVCKIEASKEGEKHDTLLRQSRIIGTYIYYGLIDHESAKIALRDAINSRKETVADLKGAYNTISDGIKHGFDNPYDISSEVVSDQQKFWYVEHTNRGAIIKFSYNKLFDFINRHGFFLYIKDDTKFLIRITDNIIETLDRHDIRRFVLDYIAELPWDIGDNVNRDQLSEKFRGSMQKLLSENQLMTNMLKSPKFNRDTADEMLFYYKNTAVKVTKDSIEPVDYSNLNGCIWKNQILKRDFSMSPLELESMHETCEFARFLRRVCNNDEQRFQSFISILGYMLCRYKDPSRSKAVIFYDECISHNPEGGTGKGIIAKALGAVRNSTTIDGKSVDLGHRFVFQQVELDTDIIVFDDVKEQFDFEKLFPTITEGINVEKKNKDKFHIPADESPAILITSNYVLKGQGNSHDRRKVEVEFSQHYNGGNTPFDEFGHNLFTDWDDDQWQQFDLFMMIAARHYLQHGLIKPELKNVERKKIIQQTRIEFETFASKLLVTDVKYSKKELFNEFKDAYPDFRAFEWFNQTVFNKWLRIYAEIKNWRFDEWNSSNNLVIKFYK